MDKNDILINEIFKWNSYIPKENCTHIMYPVEKSLQ